MTNDLIERLRKLAEQQAAPPDQSYHEGRLLTKEDTIYWKAADEITELREALKPFADVARTFGPGCSDNYKAHGPFTVGDLRTARAKYEGSGS